MPNTTKAERFPDRIEELLGFLRRHLASELGADECPAPLAESLRVYTRAVIAATRDEHEHLTPVVHPSDHGGAIGHFRNDTTLSQSLDINAEKNDSRPSEYARPTLPTLPPGVDEREVPTAKVRSITTRGIPRAR